MIFVALSSRLFSTSPCLLFPSTSLSPQSRQPPSRPEDAVEKQNPRCLLPRQGVRPANVEQIRDIIELDVDGLDLPVAFILRGAEDGNAANRLLSGAKGGLPDQRNLIARVG